MINHELEFIFEVLLQKAWLIWQIHGLLYRSLICESIIPSMPERYLSAGKGLRTMPTGCIENQILRISRNVISNIKNMILNYVDDTLMHLARFSIKLLNHRSSSFFVLFVNAFKYCSFNVLIIWIKWSSKHRISSNLMAQDFIQYAEFWIKIHTVRIRERERLWHVYHGPRHGPWPGHGFNTCIDWRSRLWLGLKIYMLTNSTLSAWAKHILSSSYSSIYIITEPPRTGRVKGA